MRDVAQIALKRLEGLPLTHCSRGGSMLMLSFGTLHTVPRLRGGTQESYDFALHIQCAWRFRDPTRVLVGGQDLYYPADLAPNEPIPEGFVWDVSGANRCDRFFDSFMAAHAAEPIVVTSIVVDDIGGFELHFSAAFQLDVFPDIGTSEEVWRLFRPGHSGHFVMKGDRTVSNALA